MITLEQLREDITSVDEVIVALLYVRMDISRQIAQYKKGYAVEIVNLEREQEVRKKCIEFAKEKGLDEDFINKIYDIIILQSRKVQQDEISK